MAKASGQKLAEEFSELLRARNALIWVVTAEEVRVERILIEAAAAAKYPVRLWDMATGISDINGREALAGRKAAKNPEAPLEAILAAHDRGAAAFAERPPKTAPDVRAVWILRDYDPYVGNPIVCRAVRTLARALSKSARDHAQAIVVLATSDKVPAPLQDHAAVIKVALPDRAEIGAIFDVTASAQVEAARAEALRKREDGDAAHRRSSALFGAVRSAAIEAAVGLSAQGVELAFARSLIANDRRIVPAAVAAEKRAVVSREKGLEWYEADPRGLDGFGGLDNFKAWLRLRQVAFGDRARAFGLPLPKGVLIVGVPGTGKSLAAKCIPAAWGVPLLRLDLGAMKGSLVGQSEAAIRAALSVVDAVGNCVLWLDEIEKALGGAASANDSGVSQDALGTLLQWMNDRRGGAFVVATANDVTALPPELLRKGRFDEIWSVDLPSQSEREEILRVALRQHGRGAVAVDLAAVAAACDEFTGSEIAALVPEALFRAFADGERSLTTEDLVVNARATVPLAKTAAESIARLRLWAQGRARPASGAVGAGAVLDVSSMAARHLDIEPGSN